MNPRVPTLLLSLAVLLGADTLAAQGRPLRVRPEQGLSFGSILPGVAVAVSPSDPLNAASAEVSGRGGNDVLISFLLPTQLDGPSGGAIPLSFGPGSAGYSPTLAIDAQIGFDPNLTEVVALPNNGRLAVYLGAIATPPAQLPAGAYAATVTLVVSYLGS